MRVELTDLCRQLRLAHVVEHVGLQQNEQVRSMVEQLLTAELEGRRRAKLRKLVQQAGFPHIKTFEGYVFDPISFPSGSSQEKIRGLEWVERKENLLLMGAVGTGKTHMATALGVEACSPGKGRTVLPSVRLGDGAARKICIGNGQPISRKTKKSGLAYFG